MDSFVEVMYSDKDSVLYSDIWKASSYFGSVPDEDLGEIRGIKVRMPDAPEDCKYRCRFDFFDSPNSDCSCLLEVKRLRERNNVRICPTKFRIAEFRARCWQFHLFRFRTRSPKDDGLYGRNAFLV